MALRVKWIDGGREPQCASNPQYPDGIAIDLSQGADRACQTSLRYPAPRCGHHLVTCRVCKQRVIVSTAGRLDDPTSVKVACLEIKH